MQVHLNKKEMTFLTVLSQLFIEDILNSEEELTNEDYEYVSLATNIHGRFSNMLLRNFEK